MIRKSLLTIFAAMVMCGGAAFVRGQGVSPFVDCVTFNPATNQVTAYFGFTNSASNAIPNAAGSSTNFVAPGSQNRGQPSLFQPGTYHYVFFATRVISSTANYFFAWVLDGDAAVANVNSARCVGQNFTYQGRLTESNASASGAFDFQFLLFDAQSGGTQIGSTQTLSAVNVNNGTFTVGLDFGINSLTGIGRFLEIAVKRPADASYTTLSPRQPVSPVPYASYSERAAIADTATNAAQLNNVPGGRYIAKDANGNATISGSLTVSGTLNASTLNAGTIGGNLIVNGSVTSGCRSGFTAIVGGRLCVSAMQSAATFYGPDGAVATCKNMQARVGTSADVMLTLAEVNYFGAETRGWLADHFGDNVWGAWLTAGPSLDFDGPPLNVNTGDNGNPPSLPYRCVY